MPKARSVPAQSPRATLLLIDDEEEIRESLRTLLELEDYRVETAATAEEGLSELRAHLFDLVLLDYMLPDKTGLEVLDELREIDHETPVVMLTAYGSVETAVQAVKKGANDFFTKPWNNEKLLLEIDRILRGRHLESENARLRAELRQKYSFSNLIGKSEAMQRVFELIAQVAPSRANVLIQGESGTGKELIARAIHSNSPRTDDIFLPANTGSIPVDLLESTLFGHIKGSFTGAFQTQKGYFERADEGTLFLDEIGTLNLETQAKLLRVLQEREFIPVGANEPIRVDVRIIAATNADLAQLKQTGEFREDLYYRLNVIQINLPPLRERKEDIPLLVDHFLDKYCRENERFLNSDGRSELSFKAEALQILMDYNWPGNVRELENVVERAVVLARDPEIAADLLPESILAAGGVRRVRLPEQFTPSAGASLYEIVEEFERRLITEELQKCNWNQTECAKHFHVALSTLNQKIQRLNIDVKKLKAG